jgi:eukaryotic-like serine/threonine-protein kinase
VDESDPDPAADGAAIPMKATPRDILGAAAAETIAHQPNHQSGPDGAQGAHEMTTPRGQHRYAFGSGARPLEGYTIKRAIGRGGFGEVYYATSDAGKEVALKLITRNHEVERRGVVQCMNLKCPNLITIYDLKTNDDGDTFVVMEYVAGPNLASILAQHPNGLPPDQIRMWVKGLVDGVAYLHDHGIVHRDLKPANLFLEEGVVKIGDYGLSKAITAGGLTSQSECVGTCHYMAPETSTGKYQKPVDIYAIGVILYEMVTGRVPFDGESVGEVLMKHLTSRPDLSPLPPPYRALVERAMAKDPNHRPARVHDLLLPGDAPREPAVRFIGDARPPAAAPPIRFEEPAEDVLRIGMEEPVLYIGPETRPPQPRRRPPRTFNQWLWGAPAFRRAAYQPPPARRPAPPPPPPRPAPRPAPAARPAPTPPTPPPPAPALPSARVRVGELAGSMLMAAPVAALASVLSLPAYDVIGVGLPTDPQQLGLLLAATLLGSWGALGATKLGEGFALSAANRRLVMMLVGLLVGAGTLALALWTGLNPLPAWPGHADRMVVSWSHELGVERGLVLPVGLVAFFGLAFLGNAWGSLAARDRGSRFRFLPVAWAGLVGWLLGNVIPSPQPWGALVMALVALVTQAVSPWSKPAADHARAVAAYNRAAMKYARATRRRAA